MRWGLWMLSDLRLILILTAELKNDININIPESSLYFEMISQVEGIELTSFKSQIKYFSFISASKNNF